TAFTISPYVRVRTWRKTALGICTNKVSPSARLSRVGWNHVANVLMLTRDLTRSRNLSQELTVSRSRPVWVAVVIAKRILVPRYFHRCEKAVESGPIGSFCRLRGSTLAGKCCAALPLMSRERPRPSVQAKPTSLLDSAGLSLIDAYQASE